MSKLSVHLTDPGNRTGYGDFLRIPSEKGNPVSIVYQLNANTKADVTKYSPTTKLVYRRQSTMWQRVPNDLFVGDPIASCNNWMLNIKENGYNLIQLWQLNPADYYDPLNEPVPQTVAEAQWLNTWMVRALQIANSYGMKLAMYSFSVGRPEYNLWPYFYESLRLGKQYGAILSLHEYGVDLALITRNPDGSLTDNSLNCSLRHRRVYASLPADCQVPLVISEAACGNGYAVPLTGQAFVNDAIEYDKEIMKDAYVIGANLFQLGGSESNLQPVLLTLANYISVTPTTTPPPTIVESADGTTIPSATQIIDSSLNKWTFGSPVVHGYQLMRNGMQFAGGQGTLLLYYGKKIYTVNDLGQWYSATSVTWVAESGDPRTKESPDNTVVPPAAKIIDSTQAVWTLGAPAVHGYVLLKNGVQFGGGQGVLLLYYNKYVFTKNDLNEWYVAGTSGWSKVTDDPRTLKLLNVPWVGQNTIRTDDDYTTSDCGPASVAMWLRYRGVTVSVDQVSQATGLPAGFLSTSFSQLDKAANVYGLNLTYKSPMSLDQIKAEINANRPCIALVYYPALPARSDLSYTNSHWIVITGYSSAGFYYNDPYWLDERGKNIFITNAQLSNAMNLTTNNGNPAYFGIVEEFVTTLTAKRGVGMGNRSVLTVKETDALKVSGVDGFLALTMPSVGESQTIVDQVKAANPNMFIVGRLFFSADYANKTLFNAQSFLAYCQNGLDGLYSKGVRYFQVHNEPNLVQEGMGWNWNNGIEFGNWLVSLLTLLRARYPEAKWGYPGLSPQPNTEQFWADSKFAMDQCDWVGVHAYWQFRGTTGWGMESLDGGYHYKRLSTTKPLMITEFSNNSPSVSYTEKGQQYKDYYRLVGIPAFCFCLSWSGDSNKEGWVYNNGITDIPYQVKV